MQLFGAWPRIPPTPSALWHSASSVKCMSLRMPAHPGARSRVNSARSGPQSGCQTDFIQAVAVRARHDDVRADKIASVAATRFLGVQQRALPPLFVQPQIFETVAVVDTVDH